MMEFPAKTSRESSRLSDAAVRPTASGDESCDHVSCEQATSSLVQQWGGQAVA